MRSESFLVRSGDRDGVICFSLNYRLQKRAREHNVCNKYFE